MVVAMGDVFWADFGDHPRRPVVVVQGDAFNRSRIATVVCVPLTSEMRWAEVPGNVVLKKRSTGLSKDAVANVTKVVSIERQFLNRHSGRISRRELDRILAGIDLILGR